MFKALGLTDFFSEALLISPRKRHISNSYKAQSHFWFWPSVVLMALIVAALMNYVSGVNGYASTGYEIKKLQREMDLLSEQNKQMTLKISESSSMVNIENELANLNFVPIDSSRFVQAPSQYSQK